MRCPHCDHTDTRVIDSRPADQQRAIRRRRLCDACGTRFTTYERVVPALAVRKRDGRVEPFAPEKIRAGVEAALTDRPILAQAVDDLVETIESAARRHPGPIPTEEVGRAVLERLRELDEVAYLRFASVYKDFQAVQDFERELTALEEMITPGE